MPWCPRCRKDVPAAQFSRNRSSRTGFGGYCKPCHNQVTKEHVRKKHGGQKNFLLGLRYGVDEQTVLRLIEEQGGMCAICREQPAGHVDHCHRTGMVRGVLCFNCNGALGRIEDDVAVLERAIAYLVEHGAG